MKRKRVGWGEQDLFSKYWRRCTIWHQGEKRWIKRKVSKRERRDGRDEAQTRRRD